MLQWYAHQVEPKAGTEDGSHLQKALCVLNSCRVCTSIALGGRLAEFNGARSPAALRMLRWFAHQVRPKAKAPKTAVNCKRHYACTNSPQVATSSARVGDWLFSKVQDYLRLWDVAMVCTSS